MHVAESHIDLSKPWYFGNNRDENLRLSPPKWYAPFFLTSSYEYAQDYADYGVYTITLKDEINSRILDFNKPSDAKKLKWPKVVVDKIREGKNDLNSIAYDLYILAFDTNGSLMYINRSIEWMKAAEYFKQKSKNIFINVELGSSVWGSEKDHQFLLQMWKDIYDAGFDGFTHVEFGNDVLAIFNFYCIDKISIFPINQNINEEDISNNEIYLANMTKSFGDKSWFLKYIPHNISTIVDFGGGAGEFVEYIKSKLDDSINYAIVDNNESFLSSAKSKGFECFKSLQELKASKGDRLCNALLVLSSVIHKIYSYDDAKAFWKEVEQCNFKCIAIRDMSYDEKAMRHAPVDAILWVYENVLKSPAITFKGIPFEDITNGFEEQWGAICDVTTRKIDTKRLFHFLIKNRYQENWEREVQENYLPISQEKLSNILTSIGYSFKHKESSRLEFYHDCWAKDLKLKIPDNNGYKKEFLNWLMALNTHIKWFLQKDSYVKTNLNENKAAYLKKYKDEDDVNYIVDMFWAIRNRLSAPQNDIDWWIKKPFNELKQFVVNFDPSNKKQRRDSNYKQEAIEYGAKLLGTKDGYEIWYVPTYDSMKVLGRFYKGRSAKWCVASDDPDFWFDNHEDSEFVVLVREHPQNDEFDKVAIEMMNHGRYYNEDDIIPWDLENNDQTFTNDDLIHYAWSLFKDNGETRESYY